MQLRRLWATTTTLAVAMTALLALSATAALAQYPPAEAFGVSCTPEDPEPGQTVQCTVVGAEAGENLHATAEVQGVIFFEESFQADDEGRAVFSFQVPEDAEEGEAVTVTVVGEESGVASETLEVEEDEPGAEEEDEAIAAPADTDDRLAVTGSQILLLSLVGLGLVGGGALALRRRGDSLA